MPSKKNIPEGTQEANITFDGLAYQKEGVWFPLPNWAKFYLELGQHLSIFENDNIRYVVALAVPTRSYASLLIGSGIACGRSQLPQGCADAEYVDMLVALPDGTPVIYREKTKKFKAKKWGTVTSNGKLFIGIQLDEGTTNTKKYIPSERARLIEVSGNITVNLPHQQSGKEITPPSELVKTILGDNQIYDFALESRLESVIVGPINALKQELSTSLTASRTNPSESAGYLSDLVRVREFQQPGAAYRSSIIAAASKASVKVANEYSPFVVIFDGSLGFTKWRDYWGRFNWIVILDNTDRNFHYGVSQVNQEYLYRTIKQHKIKIPIMPPGIEMMLFTREI